LRHSDDCRVRRRRNISYIPRMLLRANPWASSLATHSAARAARRSNRPGHVSSPSTTALGSCISSTTSAAARPYAAATIVAGTMRQRSGVRDRIHDQANAIMRKGCLEPAAAMGWLRRNICSAQKHGAVMQLGQGYDRVPDRMPEKRDMWILPIPRDLATAQACWPPDGPVRVNGSRVPRGKTMSGGSVTLNAPKRVWEGVEYLLLQSRPACGGSRQTRATGSAPEWGDTLPHWPP